MLNFLSLHPLRFLGAYGVLVAGIIAAVGYLRKAVR
jgi:hypothetical protein